MKIVNINKLLGLLIVILALANPSVGSSAELLVEANVVSYVKVTNNSPTVNIGAVNSDRVEGSFWFTIESNTKRISIQSLVTHLYRDKNPELDYISVDESAGVDLMPTEATSINGGDLNAAFTSTDLLNKANGAFNGYKTEQVDLESSQGDFFNQEIELSSTWTRGNEIKPAGTYSGYIVLYVAVLQ